MRPMHILHKVDHRGETKKQFLRVKTLRTNFPHLIHKRGLDFADDAWERFE